MRKFNMFGSTLFSGYSKFKLFILIMVCLNIVLVCQAAGDTGTTGDYSFYIKTSNSTEPYKITCSAKIYKVNVFYVHLSGPAPSIVTKGCGCQFKVEKEGFHLKDMQWVVSGTGGSSILPTVFFNQSWFEETDTHFIWSFNITSEPGVTKITYMANQQTTKSEFLRSKLQTLKIQYNNLDTLPVALQCHGPDAGVPQSPDTTEMSNAHFSLLEKTTVVVMTESTKSQSKRSTETTKWTDGDAPYTTTTDMPPTFIGNDRNDDTPSPSGETSNKNPKTMMYIIIAAVAGGFLLVIIILVIIACIIKKKRQHGTADKRPGSSPAVLYSSMDQAKASRNERAKLSSNTTDDEDGQLLNQSEAVATTYADIDPKSLVQKDMKKQETPGGGQGQDQGLTYADLDWAANNPKQSNGAPDPREELYAKPNKKKP